MEYLLKRHGSRQCRSLEDKVFSPVSFVRDGESANSIIVDCRYIAFLPAISPKRILLRSSEASAAMTRLGGGPS
jgi:hypothetical protein